MRWHLGREGNVILATLNDDGTPHLTEGGHETIGRLLADQEDTTIVLTPDRWLSWTGDNLVEVIQEMGGDVEAHQPDTWFKDLKTKNPDSERDRSYRSYNFSPASIETWSQFSIGGSGQE